jgi:hypothetical protein
MHLIELSMVNKFKIPEQSELINTEYLKKIQNLSPEDLKTVIKSRAKILHYLDDYDYY